MKTHVNGLLIFLTPILVIITIQAKNMQRNITSEFTEIRPVFEYFKAQV